MGLIKFLKAKTLIQNNLNVTFYGMCASCTIRPFMVKLNWVVNNYDWGGGGMKLGALKYLGKLMGVQFFLKVHRVGGVQKLLGIFYLKNVYQNYGMTRNGGGGWKDFTCSRVGHKKFLHVWGGLWKYLASWNISTPRPPAVIVNNSLKWCYCTYRYILYFSTGCYYLMVHLCCWLLLLLLLLYWLLLWGGGLLWLNLDNLWLLDLLLISCTLCLQV